MVALSGLSGSFITGNLQNFQPIAFDILAQLCVEVTRLCHFMSNFASIPGHTTWKQYNQWTTQLRNMQCYAYNDLLHDDGSIFKDTDSAWIDKLWIGFWDFGFCRFNLGFCIVLFILPDVMRNGTVFDVRLPDYAYWESIGAIPRLPGTLYDYFTRGGTRDRNCTLAIAIVVRFIVPDGYILNNLIFGFWEAMVPPMLLFVMLYAYTSFRQLMENAHVDGTETYVILALCMAVVIYPVDGVPGLLK